MFYKLLSNLPFNPSLINQVAFYAKRLRQEASIRRLGFIMLALALFVQLFAFLSPPQYSLAADPNDIVYGGVASLASLQQAYRDNAHGDLQRILAQFGVGANEINQAQLASIDTRGGNVNKYYSIGRTIGTRTDSFAITVAGGSSTPIYMRTLGGWAQQVWQAYQVPSTKFGHIWILKDCGNIVTEGIPNFGAPDLHITKLSDPGNNSTVQPGQKIHYTLVFDNKGTGPATNAFVYDNLPSVLENVERGSFGATMTQQGSTLTFSLDLSGKPFFFGNDSTVQYQVNFYATIKPDTPPGTFCNYATLSSNEETAQSPQVCLTIPQPTPLPPPPPPTIVKHPDAVCSVLNATYLSRTKVQFEARATTLDGAQVNSFEFDSGTGKKVSLPMNGATGDVFHSFVFDYPAAPAPANYTAKVTAATTVGSKTADACSRPIKIEKEKQSLVTITKTANKGSEQAASQIQVDPGQQFTFNFTVKNVGDAVAKNYQMPDDAIDDVLQYADIVDTHDATLVKQTNAPTLLHWKAFNLQPSESVVKVALFKLKDQLPKTNTPPDNPKSYDCQIQNSILGSTVIVNIDKSNCAIKLVEQTTKSLPNTGPGSSLVIGFCLTAIIGYFFARARLMSKELDAVRIEYTSSGGQ